MQDIIKYAWNTMLFISSDAISNTAAALCFQRYNKIHTRHALMLIQSRQQEYLVCFIRVTSPPLKHWVLLWQHILNSSLVHDHDIIYSTHWRAMGRSWGEGASCRHMGEYLGIEANLPFVCLYLKLRHLLLSGVQTVIGLVVAHQSLCSTYTSGNTSC